MRCPKCTSIEDKVIDSRISKEGNTIRRRRECLECGHRFTTTETLVLDGMVVIKRDGRREEFDREKLVHAVRAACHKRPVDIEQITMLVEDVIDAIEAQVRERDPVAGDRRGRHAAAAQAWTRSPTSASQASTRNSATSPSS